MTDLPAPLPTLMQLAARRPERARRDALRRSRFAVLPRLATTLDDRFVVTLRAVFAVHGLADVHSLIESRLIVMVRGRASSRAEVSMLREWIEDVRRHDFGVIDDAIESGYLVYYPAPDPEADVVEDAAAEPIEVGLLVDTAHAAA